MSLEITPLNFCHHCQGSCRNDCGPINKPRHTETVSNTFGTMLYLSTPEEAKDYEDWFENFPDETELKKPHANQVSHWSFNHFLDRILHPNNTEEEDEEKRKFNTSYFG